MKKTKTIYFGATDVGQIRDHNEDSFVIIDLTHVEGKDFGVVLTVADGMGGANAGEVASDIACKVVEDRYTKLKKAPSSHRDIEKYLKNLTLEAHHQIIRHASENPACEGMGTTLVTAWLMDAFMHVVWCGDSRCYVYQKHQQSTLTPFTDDHSLVWQMVKAGELSAEEARVHEQSNIILQVLGSAEAKPSPSYLKRKLEKGDKILLCSDGLNGMLRDASIQQILDQKQELQEVVQTLITSANQAGGTDNITVIFAEVEEVGGSGPGLSGGKKLLTNKWPFLLVFGLILILLLYIFRTEDRPKFPSKEKPEIDVNSAAAHAKALAEEVKNSKSELDKTVNKKNEQAAKGGTVEVTKQVAETYDHHAEVIRLKSLFDEEVGNGIKLLEGCNDCEINPELESLNNSVTLTESLLKSQLAQEKAIVSEAERQQLKEITIALQIPYDSEQSFEDTSYGEHQYVVSTLNKVIDKINEELRKYTTNLQEKNDKL